MDPLIQDSAKKRAVDSKSIEDKEGTKADLEARLLKDGEEKTATTKEAMATHEYLAEVHSDCDWLLTTYIIQVSSRKSGKIADLGSRGSGGVISIVCLFVCDKENPRTMGPERRTMGRHDAPSATCDAVGQGVI